MLSELECQQILTAAEGSPARARRALVSLDARAETDDNPELVAALHGIADSSHATGTVAAPIEVDGAILEPEKAPAPKRPARVKS